MGTRAVGGQRCATGLRKKPEGKKTLRIIDNPEHKLQVGDTFIARSGDTYHAKQVSQCDERICKGRGGDRPCIGWIARCSESGPSWYCVFGVK